MARNGLIIIILAVCLLTVIPTTSAKNNMIVGAYYFPYYINEDSWIGIREFNETNNFMLYPDIGYYNSTDPSVLLHQIHLAQEHGISFFNFYWYLDKNNEEIYSETVQQFIQLNHTMKFMLSVSFHPWGNFGTNIDNQFVYQRLIFYMSQPNYLRLSNGRPILFLLDTRSIGNGSVNDVERFIKILKDKSIQIIGIDPVILINTDLEIARSVENADGYSCFAPYSYTIGGSYSNYVNNINNYFASFSDKPISPCFMVNFDERPRYPFLINDYSAIRYLSDWDLELMQIGLETVIDYSSEQSNELGSVIQLYAWNEWHEGGILEPNIYGHIALDIVEEVLNDN